MRRRDPRQGDVRAVARRAALTWVEDRAPGAAAAQHWRSGLVDQALDRAVADPALKVKDDPRPSPCIGEAGDHQIGGLTREAQASIPVRSPRRGPPVAGTARSVLLRDRRGLVSYGHAQIMSRGTRVAAEAIGHVGVSGRADPGIRNPISSRRSRTPTMAG